MYPVGSVFMCIQVCSSVFKSSNVLEYPCIYCSIYRVWKGFHVIRELTEKQSVNRENSWSTAVIRD